MTENGAKTMTTADRRKKVAELHLQGLTPSGIGRELDITPQLAGRDLAWVRRNQPQWLEPQPPEPNDDTIVSAVDSSTVADAPNEDGSAVGEPKPTGTVQPGEGGPEAPRRAVFASAPRVVRSDGLLDPPKPPVVDDGRQVEEEPAEEPHTRSAMQYAVDTALGKFPDDGNDDVSVDEWAEEHFDRVPYDSRERFLELDDDEKWNYVNRTRKTDRAWISIFGVLLIVVIVLVLMFQ